MPVKNRTDKKSEVILRVAEALTKDVGRGIVRLDPGEMEKIGVEVGDIVTLIGKRTTVAKVMPTFTQDRGKGLVQIDGIIRGNAQTSLDERIRVQKAKYEVAKLVVLAPTTAVSLTRERDSRYIRRLLEGLPVVVGDRVRATLFGARPQDFTVIETIPREPILIRSTTDIRIKKEKEIEKRGLNIAYEDIGGLQKEIHRIREMIELPLKYPEIFERLGIEPPKGVLLHGPPGCGKTLIARAVANETEAYFIHVNGPEIIHKFYGESEANLRKIFESASKNAPSIIFLDELDAIAPKRAEVTGEVEKRVVAQLLALMDGLESRGQVIVIGATNIPNNLDQAIRRPGRFDREISIGIPNKYGRLEILQIHTRGMPLAKGVNLEKIAQFTHGFVGADLEALCREAAMHALRKIMPEIEYEMDYIPYEMLIELDVNHDDFLEAFKEVEPSAIREVFTEVPSVTWKDVGGLDEPKEILKEIITWPLQYPELFEKTNTKPPTGVLLYGPPGCGKTLIAKAVANESEINFISIKGPELLSKWVGESEKGVREIFKKAKHASPCLIFFDEIDSIAPVRGTTAETQVTERVVSQLLTELDGVEELKGVTVLAATNRLDMVDPALLRPGRFDFLLELPLPNEPTRTAIFNIHTMAKPLNKNVSLKKLAELTENLTGADIEFICRRASMLAIRKFIENQNKKRVDMKKLTIDKKHFAEAIEQVIKRQQI